MNAKVNLQLLNTTRFDSGALGLMAMVIHPFTQPGHYRGMVLLHGKAVADFRFMVDEKSDEMQLDIDLATINQRAQGRIVERAADCNSDGALTQVVSPKGYVLFHASTGTGYSAKVAHVEGRAVFDSTELNSGDLFATTLLEPAQYSAKNTLGKASADINVSLPEDLKKQLTTMEAVNISIDCGKFNQDHIQLTSTQGIVFQINESARIVIDKKSSGAPKAEGKDGPKARWKKFHPATGKTSAA